jgi:hypothetical protein
MTPAAEDLPLLFAKDRCHLEIMIVSRCVV